MSPFLKIAPESTNRRVRLPVGRWVSVVLPGALTLTLTLTLALTCLPRAAGAEAGGGGAAVREACFLPELRIPNRETDFPRVMALSGTSLVVGGRENDRSGVRFYGRVPALGAWQEEAVYRRDLGDRSSIGDSVAVWGRLAAVGGSVEVSRTERVDSVFLYERGDGARGDWTEVAVLQSPSGRDDERFGSAVAVMGDRVFAGAFGASFNGRESGAVFVFGRSPDGGWEFEERLLPSDITEGDRFGWSLATDRPSRLVVGAVDSNSVRFEDGSVYVYERDEQSGRWSQRAKLVAPDCRRDGFGAAVAIEGDLLAVVSTAEWEGESANGALYLFRESPSGGVWRLESRFRPSSFRKLHTSLALSAGRVIVSESSVFGQAGARLLVYERGADGVWMASSIDGLTSQVAASGPWVAAAGTAVDAGGEETRALTVIRLPGTPPVLERTPVERVALEGESVTFSVAAVGVGLSYQWFFEGRALPGATGAEWVIDPVRAEDAGSYSVTVSNPHGSYTTPGAQLLVNAPPTVLVAPRSTAVAVGETVAIAVRVGGGGATSFEWSKDGVVIPGLGTAALTIPNFREFHQGAYSVRVSNRFGSVRTAPAELSVAGPGGETPDTVTAPGVPSTADFGHAVAVDGDVLAVGAPEQAFGNAPGRVAIYRRAAGGGWEQEAVVYGAGGGVGLPGDRFGAAVAVDGARVLAGAPGEDQVGAAYLFEHDAAAGGWTQVQALHIENPVPGGGFPLFGWSVDIDGDRLAVAAPYRGGFRGAPGSVFSFGYDPPLGRWVETAEIQPSDSRGTDFFGTAVDLQGDLLAVGAPAAQTYGVSSGAVYVFSFDAGGGWGEIERLTSPVGCERHFGVSLSLSDPFILVGEPGEQHSGNRGAAYLFERSGDRGWAEVERFKTPDGRRLGFFGHAVAVRGETLAIGDPELDRTGSVFVSRRGSGGRWEPAFEVVPPDLGSRDDYGFSLSANAGGEFFATRPNASFAGDTVFGGVEELVLPEFAARTPPGFPALQITPSARTVAVSLADAFGLEPGSARFRVTSNTGADLFRSTPVDDRAGLLWLNRRPGAEGDATITVEIIGGGGAVPPAVLEVTFDPPGPLVPGLRFVRRGPRQGALVWPSQAGARYQVEFADDLGAGSWRPASALVEGAPGLQTEYLDPGQGDVRKRFYRVREAPVGPGRP